MMRKNGRASCILHNFDQIELESKWVENLIRFPGLFSTTLLFTRLNLPYICLQKNKDFSYRVKDDVELIDFLTILHCLLSRKKVLTDKGQK